MMNCFSTFSQVFGSLSKGQKGSCLPKLSAKRSAHIPPFRAFLDVPTSFTSGIIRSRQLREQSKVESILQKKSRVLTSSGGPPFHRMDPQSLLRWKKTAEEPRRTHEGPTHLSFSLSTKLVDIPHINEILAL